MIYNFQVLQAGQKKIDRNHKIEIMLEASSLEEAKQIARKYLTPGEMLACDKKKRWWQR